MAPHTKGRCCGEPFLQGAQSRVFACPDVLPQASFGHSWGQTTRLGGLLFWSLLANVHWPYFMSSNPKLPFKNTLNLYLPFREESMVIIH